jgi:two-component system, NarL family, sensor kinase
VIIEALNNVLRHAEAGHVDVQLKRSTDSLTLFVVDDGRGFDPNDSSPGMGLNNMRQRAIQLNGELRIASQPGGGTTLMVKIPMVLRHRSQPGPTRGGRRR